MAIGHSIASMFGKGTFPVLNQHLQRISVIGVASWKVRVQFVACVSINQPEFCGKHLSVLRPICSRIAQTRNGDKSNNRSIAEFSTDSDHSVTLK
jgi:hypothetical protein